MGSLWELWILSENLVSVSVCWRAGLFAEDNYLDAEKSTLK